MASWWTRFLPALAILALGCETPDDDYPSGEEAVRVGAATLGERVIVSVGQQTNEWELCHPRMGEFGPWIDCEETRERAASLTSIECLPAASCRDVAIDGAKGGFFPLVPELSVKVVADVEGERIETTRVVKARKPEGGLAFSPNRSVAGARIEVCRRGEVALTFAVTLDDAPLVPSGEAHDERCTSFVPMSAGELRAVPRLLDPAIDLEPIGAVVHAPSELGEITVRDGRCFREDGVVGVHPGTDGKFHVSVTASGGLRIGTGTQQLALPASSIRLRDGGEVLASDGRPWETVAFFALSAPPSPDARIEVDLGTRVVTAPVRAGACAR